MKICKRKKCSKQFKPNKPKQVFCSDKCRVYFTREQPVDAVKENDKSKKKAEILKDRNPNRASKKIDNTLLPEEATEAAPLSDWEIQLQQLRNNKTKK